MPDLPARAVLWAILSVAIILQYANAQCPNNTWHYDLTSQVCYWIGPQIPQSWNEASNYCQNIVGVPMAFISSYQDWQFLHSLQNLPDANTYLGCTDNANEGVWVCSDGLESSGVRWSSSPVQEPNGNTFENCLWLTGNGLIYDIRCDVAFANASAVCEKRLLPPLGPSPCRSGYTSVGNLCLITMGVYSYALAEQVCPCGTHLLAFRNQRDYRAFVTSSYWSTLGSTVWLGLSADGVLTNAYDWKWTYENERILYNLWDSLEPDPADLTQSCAVLERSTKRWRTYACNTGINLPVVCMYDATKKDYSHVPAP